MSFFSNLKSIMTGGIDTAEAQTAGAAIGTSIAGCLTDPIFAAGTNLAMTCVVKDMRTSANFAGVGAALASQLVLGPVGGLALTTGLVVINRAIRGLKHTELGDANLDLTNEEAVLAAIRSAQGRKVKVDLTTNPATATVQ